MSLLSDAVGLIEPYMRQYGLIALFVIVYLESLGAPLPGESALIAASVLAARGDFAIVSLVLAVWSAAVLGDTTGYAIGRFGGRPLLQRYGKFVKLTPERLSALEEQFRGRGPMIVAGARFVVVLRQLNGLIAGSVAMPFAQFLAANALGGLAWTLVWSCGPYFFGELFGLDRTASRP